MTDVIRVLIAEDDPIVRRAVAKMMSLEPDIEVAGEAGDGVDALQQARAHRPDVVLMDIEMPRMNGIEATRKILTELPGCHVIMLTTFDHDELIFNAISAGAHAYLLKDASEAEIAGTIRAVHRNEANLSPGVARKVLDAMRKLLPATNSGTSDVRFEELTARETTILSRIIDGRSNKEIATELALAEGTVKNYVSRILEKVQAKNRTELAMLAVQRRP
ncbi:MAG: response regulator [Beijerinckiaceae bacterium]